MVDGTMNPAEQTVLRQPQSFVTVHDHVDLTGFKDSLPANIQSKITNEWSVLNAKAVAGIIYSLPSFCVLFLIRLGPFDEADLAFFSQHSDVKWIDKSVQVKHATLCTQSVVIHL